MYFLSAAATDAEVSDNCQGGPSFLVSHLILHFGDTWSQGISQECIGVARFVCKSGQASTELNWLEPMPFQYSNTSIDHASCDGSGSWAMRRSWVIANRTM